MSGLKRIKAFHADTNLLARFKELRGSLEGCLFAESHAIGHMTISMCKQHCPESFNHIPIHEDIAHVAVSWHEVYIEYEIPYVCQISGCKSIHKENNPIIIKPENRNQEVTDKLDLKTNPVTIKSEKENQENTDRTDLEVIKTELPAPEDTTYKCHHCGTGFKDNTYLTNHMKTIHNAENSTTVKSESKPVVEANNSDDKNQRVTDEENLIAIREELPAHNDIIEKDEETLVKKDTATKCHFCEKILKNDMSLKIHMENAHSTVSVKSEN